jgi:hypothetical protein
MPNRRPTAGVITRNSMIPDGEVTTRGPVKLTTVDRTAFDLARSDLIRQAVARRHPRARGIRRVDEVLDLVDAGAESPQDTRVRLLLMDNGFPRPRTQIPVVGPDGFPRYYLDMGWDDIMVAVEYDAEHHRKNTSRLSERHHPARIHSVAWLDCRASGGGQPSARSRRAGTAGTRIETALTAEPTRTSSPPLQSEWTTGVRPASRSTPDAAQRSGRRCGGSVHRAARPRRCVRSRGRARDRPPRRLTAGAR